MAIVGTHDLPGGIMNTNTREVGITRMTNANVRGTGYILNQTAKYSSNYGIGVVSTANSNLNGTGTLVTILTAASNGTLIKKVIIKGQVSSTDGMVRLFISWWDGEATQNKLMREVEIPAITKSTIRNSFSIEVDLGFYLKSGYSLKASTEKAESFNVLAEGLDFTY